MKINFNFIVTLGAVLAFCFMAVIAVHAWCIYDMGRDVKEFTLEMKQTNGEFRAMNARLGEINDQLEKTNEILTQTNKAMAEMSKSFQKIKVSVF